MPRVRARVPRVRGRGARAVLAALLAAVLCGSAASCVLGASSAQPPSPSGTGAACPGTPGVTADEVRVGLLYPDSGNAASLFAPFRAGVEARLGVANSAGGVQGRRVTYLRQDDGSQPAANRAAARTLVEQRQVFGIMESTTASAGSAEYLHSKGVPVTGTSLDPAWTVYDTMFSYSNMIADGSSVSTWGDFVAEQGGRTALIVVTSLSAASGEFAEELRASLEIAGVRVVGTVDATGPINLRAIGDQVRDSGADTLVGAVTGAAFGQVVLGAHAAGAKLRVILTPSGYDQSMLKLFGTILAGVNLFVDYQPFELELPGHRAFLEAMARYAPYLPTANQQAALSGWITADMFIRGLSVAGPCPTRQRFVEGLRAVRDYSADGLLPEPIDFAKSFGELGRCYTFMRVSSDGTRFEVLRPAPRCGTLGS
ncbi:ABC transporter substrate-binding protein [Parafrankia sp. EUN1f]|uniref:ABC transporter substrate-binding protein n=1 Tax=Parafrankia sp. EUN1f TaxID=102897 RepID=UPI0001C43ECC|nr:ABC transporter substrate-binding protein [Parafrankia sp. EUN1f]EFC84247.1 ABC-type branched-chain amino acid transport systems periplasmic component-like protein [Parafrankia sp. EUN1f]